MTEDNKQNKQKWDANSRILSRVADYQEFKSEEMKLHLLTDVVARMYFQLDNKLMGNANGYYRRAESEITQMYNELSFSTKKMYYDQYTSQPVRNLGHRPLIGYWNYVYEVLPPIRTVFLGLKPIS